MIYSAIATTVDDLGGHAKTFIESFRRDPDAEIVLVRQESGLTAPQQEIYTYDRIVDLRVPVSSRAKALNLGIRAASADWLWILDIDVILGGPAAGMIRSLDPHGVYGNDLRDDYRIGEMRCHYRWVDGWSILFHRDLYDLIGGFDEGFRNSGYLDGDFCFRAAEAGFLASELDVPLRHLQTSTRYQVPKYREGKYQNRQRLKTKWGLEELDG